MAMRAGTTAESAATLALSGLAYLAGSGDGMERFIAVSGLDPATLRVRADEADFLTSVLDFLLSDDEVLLGFCREESVDAPAVHMARHVLSGA